MFAAIRTDHTERANRFSVRHDWYTRTQNTAPTVSPPPPPPPPPLSLGNENKKNLQGIHELLRYAGKSLMFETDLASAEEVNRYWEDAAPVWKVKGGDLLRH